MGKTTDMPILPQHRNGVIPPRSELNQVLKMLSNVSGTDGVRVVEDWNGGIRIHGPGAAPSFTGIVYVAGKKYADLNTDDTKPWVKIPLNGDAPSETDVEPADPFPANEYYIRKANTSGDFHLPRA